MEDPANGWAKTARRGVLRHLRSRRVRPMASLRRRCRPCMTTTTVRYVAASSRQRPVQSGCCSSGQPPADPPARPPERQGCPTGHRLHLDPRDPSPGATSRSAGQCCRRRPAEGAAALCCGTLCAAACHSLLCADARACLKAPRAMSCEPHVGRLGAPAVAHLRRGGTSAESGRILAEEASSSSDTPRRLSRQCGSCCGSPSARDPRAQTYRHAWRACASRRR